MNNTTIHTAQNMDFDVIGRIKYLMKQRNWSQNQLAENASIPQSTVNSWFANSILPSIFSIEQICKAFDITLSEFFIVSEEEPILLTHSQQNILRITARYTPEELYPLLKFLEQEKTIY